MYLNQRDPAHKHLTAIAIDIHRAVQADGSESYPHAKVRLALDLSTEDWNALDTVYEQLEAERWEIINETGFLLNAPDRALILAALRCLQEQIERVGERHFWPQHKGLGKVATNDGMFSLPGVARINELCPRISGLADCWEEEGESPQPTQAASEEGPR